MSDYIASKMTADGLLEHLKSRPKMYDIFVELLARAWDDGHSAGYLDAYNGYAYGRTHNPYKEAPFA